MKHIKLKEFVLKVTEKGHAFNKEVRYCVL